MTVPLRDEDAMIWHNYILEFRLSYRTGRLRASSYGWRPRRPSRRRRVERRLKSWRFGCWCTSAVRPHWRPPRQRQKRVSGEGCFASLYGLLWVSVCRSSRRKMVGGPQRDLNLLIDWENTSTRAEGRCARGPRERNPSVRPRRLYPPRMPERMKERGQGRCRHWQWRTE